jgi:hypothetical protein
VLPGARKHLTSYHTPPQPLLRRLRALCVHVLAFSASTQACLDAENCEGSQLATKLQLARDAHLPCLSALLGGLARALQASTPPDGSLLALYEELPWQHGAVLLELARMEVEHMRCACVRASLRVCAVRCMSAWQGLCMRLTDGGVVQARLAPVCGLHQCMACLCRGDRHARERGMLDAARKAAAAGDAASDAFRAANRALVWRLQALAMEHRCMAPSRGGVWCSAGASTRPVCTHPSCPATHPCARTRASHETHTHTHTHTHATHQVPPTAV